MRYTRKRARDKGVARQHRNLEFFTFLLYPARTPCCTLRFFSVPSVVREIRRGRASLYDCSLGSFWRPAVCFHFSGFVVGYDVKIPPLVWLHDGREHCSFRSAFEISLFKLHRARRIDETMLCITYSYSRP